MKKAVSFVLGLTLVLSAATLIHAGENAEETAIRQLVQTAYVDGLMNLKDLDKTRAGFHPDFVLLGLRDGKLTRLPIADWIAWSEKRKKEGAKSPVTAIRSINIDITETAAAVRLELDCDGKPTYTDYLSLYRFADGWKIVGKIYYAHH